MFGFFQFAMPQFADAPHFAVQPSGGGSNGGGGESNRHHQRRAQENAIEITLMAFLNTQQ